MISIAFVHSKILPASTATATASLYADPFH